MIFEILATACVLAGVILISIPKIHGLYLMFIAQLLWAVVAFNTGLYFLFVQSLFLFCINIIGIFNWRRKRIGR